MIYTSFYNNIENIPNNVDKICISNGNPFLLQKISYFVPKWKIVDEYKKNIINKDEYTTQYLQQLEKIDKNLLQNFINKYKNADCILFCYERPNSFCHRHILAEWLNKNYNCNCREF